MQQYIGFKLDGSEYTMPILKVREIINTSSIASITKLPRSPQYMKGIINLRGSIVPILDLRQLVTSGQQDPGAPAPAGEESGGKVIVVANPDNVFGVLVDSITSVINIDEANIESAEGLAHLERIEGVARFDDRLVILLDTDRLVDAEEMAVISNELDDIQKAADMRRIAAPRAAASGQAPAAAPPLQQAPPAAAPSPVAAPAPQPAPAMPQPAAAQVAALGQAADDAGSRVTIKDLHAASDMLSKKFTADHDAGDGKGKFLSDILNVMDAMATRDLDRADELISEVVKTAEGDLYNQIGIVTRKLHDSLKDFRQSLDPRIRRLADEDVPQAVDSLEYVIKKTEEATNRTLGVVEKHLAGIEAFSSRIAAVSADHEDSMYFQDFSRVLREDLNEIMHAQEFQDITGQTIRRVIELVNAIEAELIGLIATFGVKPEAGKDAKPTSEKMTQGDVEDLLMEFGF